MRNRVLAWGIGLTAARVVSGLISQLEGVFVVFLVVVVGTGACALIVTRRAALWTFPLWYLVYGSTRVMDFGEYGGSAFAWGAAAYFWGSAIISVIVLGLGCASAVRPR